MHILGINRLAQLFKTNQNPNNLRLSGESRSTQTLTGHHAKRNFELKVVRLSEVFIYPLRDNLFLNYWSMSDCIPFNQTFLLQQTNGNWIVFCLKQSGIDKWPTRLHKEPLQHLTVQTKTSFPLALRYGAHSRRCYSPFFLEAEVFLTILLSLV